MLPDRVSNPGPLTYESGALPIALRGPAAEFVVQHMRSYVCKTQTATTGTRPPLIASQYTLARNRKL